MNRLRRLIEYAVMLGVGVGLLVANLSWLCAGYQVVVRLSYVLFVGLSLRAEDERAAGGNAEERWEKFRRIASLLMDADGVGMVALSIVTRMTLPVSIPVWSVMAVGGVMIVAGLGTKIWAARTLGYKSFYWHDFFVPPEKTQMCSTGPYRFMSDPMYTVGYLHVYGVALVFLSWPALVAALFEQATILLMNRWVEMPHFRRIYSRPS